MPNEKALYCENDETVPAGSADGILKRNLANTAWEFKTAAQLTIAAATKQTTFTEVTVAATTGSAAFVDLLTQVITTSAGSNLIIWASVSASNTNTNENIDIQITYDGTPLRGAVERVTAAGVPASMYVTYRIAGVTAAAHTVKVQWRTSANTARCRPGTLPNEHATLTIQEVTV